jgi:GT2 family glycosyltransferase
MIFPASWALEVLSAIESQEAPFTVWLTRSRDLVPGDLPDPATDEWLGVHSFPHSHAGQGGGMVVPRAWWQGVGGFDESYRVWGAEDNDLVLRALWSGLDVRWLPTTSVYHQWHSRLGTAEQLDHLQRNRRYLADRVAQCGPVYRPRVVRVDT